MKIFPRLILPLNTLRLFFLGGVSNGLPGVLTWQTLNIWLAQMGYSKSTIGLFFLSGVPYNLKIILSWFIDKKSLPFLSQRFGRKRGWAIALQGTLAVTIALLGWTTGRWPLGATAALCFCVSLLSTMNQIATVAHRIEQLDPESSSQGVAAGIFGYRLGKFMGRAGALYLLTWLSWSQIYLIFGIILLCTMTAYILSPNSINFESLQPDPTPHSDPIPLWRDMITEPFRIFSKSHPHWGIILCLLCTLNLGDAFVFGMVDLFYLEQGYTTLEIASITKVFGLACSLLGGLLATYAVQSRQVFSLLWLSSLLHLLSHALLIVLSLQAPYWGFLAVMITIEHLSAGMRATLIATWTGQLCSKYGFAGRQYAFFSSLKAIPYFIIASLSGFVADYVSWPIFFTISFSLALPSLLILSQIRQRIWSPMNSETVDRVVKFQVT